MRALKRLEMDYQRKKELYGKKLVSAEDFERVAAEYQAHEGRSRSRQAGS